MMEFLTWMFRDLPTFIGMMLLIMIIGSVFNMFIRRITWMIAVLVRGWPPVYEDGEESDSSQP